MTREEALKRLDEIESLSPDPTIDAGAYGIMSELAHPTDGLSLLVERYGGSPSANIVGYLALVLADKSQASTLETAPLTFEFAAKLKRSDYDGALISILGAMQRQLGFGAGWGGSPHPPSSFFTFLQHCLNYSGRNHFLIQSGAVEVISVLCWGRLLGAAFDEEQIGWLKTKIDQLSKIDNDLLKDSITEFEQCLSEEK